jgi:hypothetical protein
VNMAVQLVAALEDELDMTEYRDEYRDRVLELVEAKASGQVIKFPEAEEEGHRRVAREDARGQPEGGGQAEEGQWLSTNEDDGSPRAFWSGTITFGLVSIPVELFPANRSQRVSLRMVSEDGVPLARRYFCPAEDRALEWGEIVRGYEVEKDASSSPSRTTSSRSSRRKRRATSTCAGSSAWTRSIPSTSSGPTT